MAGFSHQVTTTVKVDGVTFANATKTFNNNAIFSIDETIPADTDDMPIDADFAVSHAVSVVMVSNKDVTIKTNNSGTPVDEFVLKAGVPYVWNTDHHEDLILTEDVTGLFISNADPDAAARVKMTVLLDSTLTEG